MDRLRLLKRGIKTIIIFFAFLLVVINTTNFALAAGVGIWEGTQCAENSSHGGPTIPCDFCDAMIVANNILNMLVRYALVIAGIMVVVGGVLILISMGPSSSKNLYGRGRKTVTMALVGSAVALSSYIIVGTFFHIITGKPDFPWNKVNCTHNVAYKAGEIPTASSTTASTTLENVEWYAKIANDGKMACGLSTEEVGKYSPRDGEIKKVNEWKNIFGVSDDTKICGKKVIEEIKPHKETFRSYGQNTEGEDTNYYYYEKCDNSSGTCYCKVQDCYIQPTRGNIDLTDKTCLLRRINRDDVISYSMAMAGNSENKEENMKKYLGCIVLDEEIVSVEIPERDNDWDWAKISNDGRMVCKASRDELNSISPKNATEGRGVSTVIGWKTTLGLKKDAEICGKKVIEEILQNESVYANTNQGYINKTYKKYVYTKNYNGKVYCKPDNCDMTTFNLRESEKNTIREEPCYTKEGNNYQEIFSSCDVLPLGWKP